MSEAKICDRCGRTFIGNTSLNNLFHIGGDVTISVNGYRNREYDLCDECLNDFYKFMKIRRWKNDSILPRFSRT